MNQKIITNLLPSEELKNKIEELNYKFSEHELILIAEEYSETINDKLENLLFLSKNLIDKDEQKFAKLRADKIEAALNKFAESEENTVYFVEIKDSPDACADTYICKDYHSAIVTIALYQKEFEVSFNEFSYIKIAKKQIISDKVDLLKDESGIVTLNKNLYPDSVWYESIPDDFLVDISQINFPNILKPYSPVKFKDYYGWSYGLQINKFRETANDDAFVIRLTEALLEKDNISSFGNYHTHISIPRLIQLNEEALPEKEREYYNVLISYLKDENII